MEDIFRRRPFKTRNADEYGLEGVLNLFVSPVDGLATPFDYENSIIKGRMGSGKTMYLRANHAYYLYGMVPALMDRDSELVLPILIRLSDFQHLRDPSAIYREIVIKIVEEITSVYLRLKDAKSLAELHSGIRVLSDEMLASHQFSKNLRALARLGSEEYIERVTTGLGIKGGVKNKFFEASSEWSRSDLVEFKRKSNPGIKDIEECYKTLLEDQNGKLLLLIDEAGALDRSFFASLDGSSLFETLMNQFRTSDFIRTKIALYPNSYSDILTETRYGDTILLEETVKDDVGYKRFYGRTLSIIENYLNPDPLDANKIDVKDVFEMTSGVYGGCLEQILYASSGNMRRLIQILDMAMNQSFILAGQKPAVVTKAAVLEALKGLAGKAEALFSEQERIFLGDLVSACRARGGFKFTFPNMSPILYKYTNKSQEYNIINVDSLGSGRRRTIYDFDYSYAILKDIPTHYQMESEKINRERSLDGGVWIGRTVQINEEVMDQAALPGKVDGCIGFFVSQKGHGFIRADDDGEFFFSITDIIETDKGKSLMTGRRVRFYPYRTGDTPTAAHVELLV